MDPNQDQAIVTEASAPQDASTPNENDLTTPEDSDETSTVDTSTGKGELPRTRNSGRILSVIEENCSVSEVPCGNEVESTESVVPLDKRPAMETASEINPSTSSDESPPSVGSSEDIVCLPNGTRITSSPSVEITGSNPSALALPTRPSTSATSASDNTSGYASASHTQDPELAVMPTHVRNCGRKSFLKLSKVSTARTKGSVMFNFNHQTLLLERLQQILAGDHGQELAETTLHEMTRQATITLGSTHFPSTQSFGVSPFLVFDEDKSFHYAFIYDNPGHTYMTTFMATFFPPRYLELQKELYSQMLALQRPFGIADESTDADESIQDIYFEQHQQNFVTSTPCQRQLALSAPAQQKDAASKSTPVPARPRATKALTPSLNAEAEKSTAPVQKKGDRQTTRASTSSRTVEENTSQPIRSKRSRANASSAPGKSDKNNTRASSTDPEEQSSAAPVAKKSRGKKTVAPSTNVEKSTGPNDEASVNTTKDKNCMQLPAKKKNRRTNPPLLVDGTPRDTIVTRRRSLQA